MGKVTEIFFSLDLLQIVSVLLLIAAGWFSNDLIRFLKLSNPWKRFRFRLSTAEQYWRISVTFVIFLLIFALGIIYLSAAENRVTNLTLLVNTAVLLFGLYTGYFAFKQVNYSRFNEVLEMARDHFRKREYKRAIREYESLSDIKFDFEAVSEQIECYACLEDWKGYEKLIEKLPHVKVDDRDELVLLYLKSLKPFFNEEIGRAKEIVKDAIVLKRNFKNDVSVKWRLDEVEGAEPFKLMEKSNRDFLEKFFSYLNDPGMDETERKAFEEKYSDPDDFDSD